MIASSYRYAAGLGDKIAVIAVAACAKANYRPATTEGVRQLADLTLSLLRSPARDVGYVLGKVRGNVALIASTVLKVPGHAA